MNSRIACLAFVPLVGTFAFGAASIIGDKGPARRTRLAAGQQHTCAVLDDGTVRCWGRNNFGQVGDGTVMNKLSPVPVSNLGAAISVTAGSFHSCAILSNGSVRCWGLNDSGQLGNGTNTSSSVPVTVPGLSGVVSVAAGGVHTCAARIDGTVWCWGAYGATATSNSPVKVLFSGAVSVTAGANHSCAALASGEAVCWGKNDYGQLGDGSYAPTNLPAHVTIAFYTPPGSPPLLILEMIAAGSFSCAQTNYVTFCWGDNSYGQFGDGYAVSGNYGNFPNGTTGSAGQFITTSNSYINGVRAISAGATHTCAISRSATVLCSGLNDALQVGPDPYHSQEDTPVDVPSVANVVEIAAGAKHSCASLADGTIRCWGDNSYGQHGNGAAEPAGTDSVVGISGTFLARGLSAGNQLTCARRGNGVAACWGAGEQGQLGDGLNVASPNPITVTGLRNLASIAAGAAHACAADATGVVSCWGDNSQYQLGDYTATPSNQPVTVKVQVLLPALSAGGLHTCGISNAEELWCWGASEEIGGWTTTSPGFHYAYIVNGRPVQGLAIAAGSKFNCALIPDKTVQCWGDNSLGQLGNGGTAPSALPATVPGLSNIVGITAGTNHACALTAFGSILCWGDNSRGQIGNNSTNRALTPAAVQGISDAVSVSAGAYYTCAVHADGTASCWGANDNGELGAANSLDHLTPAPVTADTAGNMLTGVVQIAAGTGFKRTVFSGGVVVNFPRAHTCALLASGILRCWGDNLEGEIGDGTTTNRARPTAVNSFVANVDPDASLRNSRIVEVTALINCDPGQEAQITLGLEQGATTGMGHAEARCEGHLLQVPVTVPAQGSTGFQAGAASAHVEAIVRRGASIVEDTHWTKEVLLSISK